MKIKIFFITALIFTCTEFTYSQKHRYDRLDIMAYCDTFIEISYNHMDDLKFIKNNNGLVISDCNQYTFDSVFHYILKHKIKIKALALSGQSTYAVNFSLEDLTDLKFLFVSCEIKDGVRVQEQILKLKNLSVLLWLNDGGRLMSDIDKLKNLTVLWTTTDTPPVKLVYLKKLIELSLGGSDLSGSFNIKLPRSLKKLGLSETKINNIDNLLELAPGLKYLDISYSNVRNLSSTFDIKKLSYIRITNCTTDYTFYKRIMDTGINCEVSVCGNEHDWQPD